jgi:hypothetical protein
MADLALLVKRMSININGDLDFLRSILQAQNRQRQIECQQLAREVASVPVSERLLTRLCELGLDFPAVITAHPGFALDQKMNSLWAVLEIFRRAYADLQGKLHEFSTYNRQNRTKRKDAEFERIIASVIKETFAACSAASALRDHARNVRGLLPEDEFRTRLASSIDSSQHEFVIKLRNVLTHQMFVEPDWKITYHFGDENNTKTSRITNGEKTV